MEDDATACGWEWVEGGEGRVKCGWLVDVVEWVGWRQGGRVLSPAQIKETKEQKDAKVSRGGKTQRGEASLKPHPGHSAPAHTGRGKPHYLWTSVGTWQAMWALEACAKGEGGGVKVGTCAARISAF